MPTNIMLVHGAGSGALAADKLLADRLQHQLGSGYQVDCRPMPDEANAPYELWKPLLEQGLQRLTEPAIAIGHSIGGSHLAKVLTETETAAPIAGAYLLAAPFWGGDGWHYPGFELLEISKAAARKLAEHTKIFIYHAYDDEIVPFNHVSLYAQMFNQATVREIANGGHQFENGTSAVAEDIRFITQL